jgi:glycosyltransferase involved in cell wall biosynthesis
VVACNGCTDDTAEIASRFEGVRVIQIDQPSKIAALNEGDMVAKAWPRLYLDADIEIGPGAVARIFDALTTDGRLAARPEFRYDTSRASALVKAYYRARQRMPITRSALWGAGAYAVNEEGHGRFGSFPPLIADDLFVDRLFSATEKDVVATPPARVRTPRTTRALIAVLTRQHRGNLQAEGRSTSSSTVRALVSSIRGVPSLFDAAVYAFLTIVGRRAARSLPSDDRRWHRDESSR